MIKFEQGSGAYVSGAEVFNFNASDEQGPVRCAISREAFEDLIGESVTESAAAAQFSAWEAVVFRVAEEKYDREGLNDRGAVTVSAADVMNRRAV